MNPTAFRILGPAVVLLAAVAAVFLYPTDDGIVAEIGPHVVTPRQLALRQAHVEVYYPGSGKPETALAQLVQGYLAAAVLERQGVRLDRSTWVAEDERIARQTRDAETLARLRGVYGDDTESWLYVGVLPDFAQSRAFKYYRSARQPGEAAKSGASTFLDGVVQTPTAFAATARRQGLEPATLLVHEKKGLLPLVDIESPAEVTADMAGEEDPATAEAARLLLERLAGQPDGSVYPRTLETPDGFNVVRLVRRVPGGAVIELVEFAKPSYGDWFWKEAAEIPVRIGDRELEEAFRAAVSWSQAVNLQ